MLQTDVDTTEKKQANTALKTHGAQQGFEVGSKLGGGAQAAKQEGYLATV